MCRHPAANRRKLLILDFGSMETEKNVEAVARGGFLVMRDRYLRRDHICAAAGAIQ